MSTVLFPFDWLHYVNLKPSVGTLGLYWGPTSFLYDVPGRHSDLSLITSSQPVNKFVPHLCLSLLFVYLCVSLCFCGNDCFCVCTFHSLALAVRKWYFNLRSSILFVDYTGPCGEKPHKHGYHPVWMTFNFLFLFICPALKTGVWLLAFFFFLIFSFLSPRFSHYHRRAS